MGNVPGVINAFDLNTDGSQVAIGFGGTVMILTMGLFGKYHISLSVIRAHVYGPFRKYRPSVFLDCSFQRHTRRERGYLHFQRSNCDIISH